MGKVFLTLETSVGLHPGENPLPPQRSNQVRYDHPARLDVATCASFAYSQISPEVVTELLVSQLVQTEYASLRPLTQRAALSLWQTAVLTFLSVWLYGPTLYHLVGQWLHDPNFSHGFFVPLFTAFVIWQNRHRLSRLALQPSWIGLGFLALALGLLVLGELGAELFLARFSLVLFIAGLAVFFLGWNYLRSLFFPLAFLLLMIPIPTIVFNGITFPLQLLASRVAATSLPWLGVPVLREGNVIVLPSMALEVADACSGIRSLMSLVTLAIIYGYLMEKRVSVRVLLALASIPIAVLANSARIIGTGLLVQYWDSDKAEGFFHASWGWIIFVLSLVMLYLFHRLVRALWGEKGAVA
jgi:exosortase